jgi:MSHA biogenesis protein MshL
MVILEAKVIEVELSDSFRSGIDWAAFSSTTGSSTVVGQRGDGGRLIDLVDPASGGFVPFDRTVGLAANPFGGVFSAALRIRNFAAFIEMLETQGRIEVLSSPRVTAMNNQKAVIKVGSDEYFVTSIASQTTVGTATSTSSNVQLTPFFSGISLDVTPQISADGWVTLHIQPTVSEVIDQTKSIPIGDQIQSVPLAYSSVRQSDSIVRARSGQVIVIGGLMRSQHNGGVSQIPGADLLKGIGSLFQHTDQSDTKSELVILLRPIVPNDSTWSERIREQEQRLRTTGKRRRDGLR